MPALPLLVLVAAGSLAHAPAWGRIIVRALIGLGLMYQLAYALSPLPGDPRWFTRLDLLRTGAALSPTDVPRVPAHIRYLNQVAQPGEGVLLVGDAAVYPLRPRAWYHTCFDASLLVDWTLDSSAEARRAHFVRRRIVWVVVNPAELERYRQPGNYGYDPRFRETILDELIAAGILTPVEWQVALPSAEPSRTKIYRVEGGSHD
jgi:hypothetical protein